MTLRTPMGLCDRTRPEMTVLTAVDHQFRQRVLSADRVRRLSDIGFDFEPYDSAWLLGRCKHRGLVAEADEVFGDSAARLVIADRKRCINH